MNDFGPFRPYSPDLARTVYLLFPNSKKWPDESFKVPDKCYHLGGFKSDSEKLDDVNRVRRKWNWTFLRNSCVSFEKTWACKPTHFIAEVSNNKRSSIVARKTLRAWIFWIYLKFFRKCCNNSLYFENVSLCLFSANVSFSKIWIKLFEVIYSMNHSIT